MKNEQPAVVFMSIPDAARTTGLSQYFLRQGVRDGSVPCLKSGTKYLVNVPLLIEQLNAVCAKGKAV